MLYYSIVTVQFLCSYWTNLSFSFHIFNIIIKYQIFSKSFQFYYFCSNKAASIECSLKKKFIYKNNKIWLGVFYFILLEISRIWYILGLMWVYLQIFHLSNSPYQLRKNWVFLSRCTTHCSQIYVFFFSLFRQFWPT